MAKKVVKKATKKATSKVAVKKAAPKKKAVKKPTSLSRGGKAAPKKKAATKKNTAKKVVVKDKEIKAANLIANSELKKKTKRPKKVSTSEETGSLLDAIIEGMHERKAKNVTIMDLAAVENRICDFFVICDAESKTHVESIADSVDETVRKKINEKPFHAEGHQNAEWILMDYTNIVVHVFQKEFRDYYNLEALWADAEITTA